MVSDGLLLGDVVKGEDLLAPKDQQQQDQPTTDPYPGIKFVNSPPVVTDPPASMLIDSMGKALLYGKLVSTSPVAFAKEPFRAVIPSNDTNCSAHFFVARDRYEIGRANAPGHATIDGTVSVKIDDEGYFWYDNARCAVYQYKKTVPDNVLAPTSKDPIFRSKYLVFAGELTDLTADLPVHGKKWDMTKKYQARIDKVYLNIIELALQKTLTVRIVGWVPPKKGKIYFWADVSPGVIDVQAYIAAEPRKIWFSTLTGRYKITVDKIGTGSTVCAGQNCVTSYPIDGKVVSTKEGLELPAQQVVSFSTTETLAVGKTYLVGGEVDPAAGGKASFFLLSKP
ncbi:MAG: hypothetical protein KAI47_04465 [Deltaproteobacteria bacterium]|nr:hypothetical protein [Deltaproteobacteria bacterium]